MKYLSSSAASSSRDRPRTERRSPSFGKRGTEGEEEGILLGSVPLPRLPPHLSASVFIFIAAAAVFSLVIRRRRRRSLSCLRASSSFLPSFLPLDDVVSSVALPALLVACRKFQRDSSGSAPRNRVFPLIGKNDSLPLQDLRVTD